MDSSIIPLSLQRMWYLWNIRGFMIMSLSVQLVLALASPFRKRTSNFVIISIIWSAYFLADWTAIFAFGLISNAGCNKSPSYVAVSDDSLALWASFLLVHLGGPDTITAFSLEDNALWLRHLVGLIAQVFAFSYIFVKTLPSNKLMGPVLLIFVAGVIKYGERTRALYLASLENFKYSTIKMPDLGEGVDLVTPDLEEGAGSVNDRTKAKKKKGKKLGRAFHFFPILKDLIVDIMQNRSQRLESQKFFVNQNADSTFELMSKELNLLYDVFYTKTMAARSSLGVLLRTIVFYLYIMALVLFCINKKDGIHTTDVWITYALLAGVIALESVSEVMLFDSDWTWNNRYLGCQTLVRCFIPFLVGHLLNLVMISLIRMCRCGHVVKRSWSDKIGSFSLLVYSFEEGRRRSGSVSERCGRAFFGWIAKKIGIAESIAKMRYASKISMDKEIWTKVFDKLKRKAENANEPDQVKQMYEARGEQTLKNSSDELKRYVSDFEYDQTVLFWHIATEICYNTDPNLDKNNMDVKLSKTFSDYMIYLLVKQPDVMSAVAGIFHLRFRDTCAELKRHKANVRSETLQEFSSSIIAYGYGPKPCNDDRNAGLSVLMDSSWLAIRLIDSESKWVLICGVWVELLMYAAGHCRAVSHARLISEGGEFVTFVWLAMAHLGLGPHFPKN